MLERVIQTLGTTPKGMPGNLAVSWPATRSDHFVTSRPSPTCHVASPDVSGCVGHSMQEVKRVIDCQKVSKLHRLILVTYAIGVVPSMSLEITLQLLLETVAKAPR